LKSAGILTAIAFSCLILPSDVHARGAQVRGVDPEYDPEVRVNRPWKQFESDRKPVAVNSGPYDPQKGLRSPLEVTRAEAASYIGWARRHDLARDLAVLLDRSVGCGPDVVSALWALGQVGGPAEVPSLLKWAQAGSVECRTEALKSLAERKAPEALPVFIEGLTRPAGSGEDPASLAQEHRLCYESLARLGDATCLPALRRLEAIHHGKDAWSSMKEGAADEHEVLARQTLALLAACGDAGARRHIAGSIHRGSRVTRPDALLKAAAQGGNVDGFPWGFWIGKALLIDEPPRPNQWPTLSAALELLEERPEALDAILRDAAGRDGTPDGARALLLGCLSSPTASDVASLATIWQRSNGEGALLADLAVPSGGGNSVTVRYNLNAHAVVYALGRLGAGEELKSIREETPTSNRALQGDIALALARTGSREYVPLVAEYVAREWDRAARSPDFELRQGETEAIAGVLTPETSALDLSYRNSDITGFLMTHSDRATMRRLVLEETLHPYFRAYWIQRLAGGRDLWRIDLAGEGLARLEEAEGAPRLLSALRTKTRQTLQAVRNRTMSGAEPLQ
jgi:hypothetical protein